MVVYLLKYKSKMAIQINETHLYILQRKKNTPQLLILKLIKMNLQCVFIYTVEVKSLHPPFRIGKMLIILPK